MFAKYCRQKKNASFYFVYFRLKNELLFIHFCKELIAWFQFFFKEVHFLFWGNECAKNKKRERERERTVGSLCYSGCIKINGKKINFQIEMTV